MNKISISSIILAGCILLIPLGSPLVYSEQVNPQEGFPIETFVHSEAGGKKQTTYLSSSELVELRQLLILLDEALTKKDSAEIQRYEAILKSKAVIPESYRFERTKPVGEPRYLKAYQRLFPLTGDDLANSLCYVHATGTGLLVFTIGVLLIIPTLLLISIFGFDVLKVLLPVLLVIMLVTHLIPFRVLLPIGVIILEEGRVSTVGSAGSQQITVEAPSVQVNLLGFTGITINIPSTNMTQGFLFVSGFSLYASSQNTSQNHTVAGMIHHPLFPCFLPEYHR